MPRVVITGGPGVGKTTLLRALAGMGHAVVEESAREVIRDRRARGLPPRPDAPAFAAEILQRDRAKYLQALRRPGWTFFDRSPLEAIGMLADSASLPDAEVQSMLGDFSFHPQVFVPPPWAGIYAQDEERDHPFEHCIRVHDELVRWYTRLGYRIEFVPPMSALDRARHVLQVLQVLSGEDG